MTTPAEAIILQKFGGVGSPSLTELQNDVRALGSGGTPTTRLGAINSIQRGSMVFDLIDSETDIAIISVSPGRTVTHFSCASEGSTTLTGDRAHAVTVRGRLLDATNLRFNPGVRGSQFNNPTIRWEVIEFSP